MDYILGEKGKGCIFCKRSPAGKKKGSLILYQTPYAFVMMNKFPYNNGHLMVVPKRHCPDLVSLDEKEFQDLFSLVRLTTEVLKVSLGPHGFNIGINLGKVAGAGVVDHVHIHVVPRWRGDTNFMPIIGETKVVPEYLEQTYQKLRSEFMAFDKGEKPQKGGDER